MKRLNTRSKVIKAVITNKATVFSFFIEEVDVFLAKDVGLAFLNLITLTQMRAPRVKPTATDPTIKPGELTKFFNREKSFSRAVFFKIISVSNDFILFFKLCMPVYASFCNGNNCLRVAENLRLFTKRIMNKIIIEINNKFKTQVSIKDITQFESNEFKKITKTPINNIQEVAINRSKITDNINTIARLNLANLNSSLANSNISE